MGASCAACERVRAVSVAASAASSPRGLFTEDAAAPSKETPSHVVEGAAFTSDSSAACSLALTPISSSISPAQATLATQQTTSGALPHAASSASASSFPEPTYPTHITCPAADNRGVSVPVTTERLSSSVSSTGVPGGAVSGRGGTPPLVAPPTVPQPLRQPAQAAAPGATVPTSRLSHLAAVFVPAARPLVIPAAPLSHPPATTGLAVPASHPPAPPPRPMHLQPGAGKARSNTSCRQPLAGCLPPSPLQGHGTVQPPVTAGTPWLQHRDLHAPPSLCPATSVAASCEAPRTQLCSPSRNATTTSHPLLPQAAAAEATLAAAAAAAAAATQATVAVTQELSAMSDHPPPAWPAVGPVHPTPTEESGTCVLDLPADVLTHVLLRAPWAARAACSAFRAAVHAGCTSLVLRLRGTTARPAQLHLMLWRLPGLAALHCAGCPIYLLDAVAMPTLTALSLQGSADLRHVDPLASCTALTDLTLSNCVSLASVAALRSCGVHLTALSLCGCVSLTDAAPLASCRALATLNAAGCTSLDITSLVGLCGATLTSLDLSNLPDLASLSPLNACTGLKTLDLLNCSHLGDVTPLTHCVALTRLNLRGCVDLVALPPGLLAALPALRCLDLTDCCYITDFTPLAGAAALASLTAAHCRGLSNLAPLASCAALLTLDLTHCAGATCLAPLACHPALTELSLASCSRVTCLAPLRACAHLRRLDLAKCTRVRDVAPLAACGALEDLDLSHCTRVRDIAALAACAALQRLRLHSCRSGVLEQGHGVVAAARPGLAVRPEREDAAGVRVHSRKQRV